MEGTFKEIHLLTGKIWEKILLFRTIALHFISIQLPHKYLKVHIEALKCFSDMLHLSQIVTFWFKNFV